MIQSQRKKYGFIAVSRGEGYNAIMESLNIDKIIAGGQTMNPSTEDIFKAIEEINAENIIIFPNNKNIIMSAKQAAEVTEKNAYVVDTRSIPETFTALLEFDESLSAEENLENMNEIIEDIHIAEVSISIRDTSVNDIKIRKDDYIGILDGKIVATDSSMDKTLELTIDKISRLRRKLIQSQRKKYGFIAVSRGEGYNAIMESLNIDKIIAGGQTMNPSTEDIFKAIEEINAENIIIFPNNKNIIMSAKQAAEVTEKNAYVVDTRSIPETFTALLEFDESLSAEENLENMNEIIEDIHIAEVSISIRDTSVNDIKIRKDDYIGILDGKIVATDSSMDKTLELTIDKIIEEGEVSLVTVYYGEDVDKRKAKEFVKKLSKKYKDVDCELVYGGQPVYYYTVTLE